MNNSNMRLCTLASCGGLLALTACGGQEATTPLVEPTQSANTPPPKINLRSQSMIPLPRVASRPELSPTALVRSRAIALSGGGSPFSDQEIQARLQQARLKREQLAKTRLAQLQAQRSPFVSSTVTTLPQQPVNLNPNLPKPLIPTPPPAPTLQREVVSRETSQAPATIVSLETDVPGTSLETPSLGSSPQVSPICPGLVHPVPTEISFATVNAAPSLSNVDQPASPQPSTPDITLGGSLETSRHQSYSATRGTFPCLTATRLPSQMMRIHSQVLNQSHGQPVQGSVLLPQGSSTAESLQTSTNLRTLSSMEGQAIDYPSQAPLALPESIRRTPGFSSSSPVNHGSIPEAINGQRG